jgi:2-haloacid dehalogenase
MNLSSFKVLSFDCYGTLIDWESGIVTALQPLIRRAKVSLGDETILTRFAACESAQQAATPDMRYAELLSMVHARLAKDWGVSDDVAEDRRFGASVGDWPAFPDTVAALRALQERYRLVILSNVDRDSFRSSNDRLGITFDGIHTAEDIGSYKPDPRNFSWLVDRLAEQGFEKSDILHVAQSLYHDHAPANAIGLASAWIDRRRDAAGWGATMPPPADVRYDCRFESLAALAEHGLKP